jgi:hypothetical protein
MMNVAFYYNGEEDNRKRDLRIKEGKYWNGFQADWRVLRNFMMGKLR